MSDNMRKAIYSAVGIVVIVLTSYGVISQQQGVLWGNVAIMTLGFAYAASRATGNRLLDPGVRRALYVLAPAIVGLIGGYWNIDVALWTSLVLAVFGVLLAIFNVDPEEQKEVNPPSIE